MKFALQLGSSSLIRHFQPTSLTAIWTESYGAVFFFAVELTGSSSPFAFPQLNCLITALAMIPSIWTKRLIIEAVCPLSVQWDFSSL